MTYLADRLGDYVAGLKYDDIPQRVTRHAKLCLLDALGVGLASADMPWCHAVHRLVRAQGGLTPSKDGTPERRTGLGIPLARQLIEAHDGTLDIASRKGAGTTATIRLP